MIEVKIKILHLISVALSYNGFTLAEQPNGGEWKLRSFNIKLNNVKITATLKLYTCRLKFFSDLN